MTAAGLLFFFFGSLFAYLTDDDFWEKLWGLFILIGIALLGCGLFIVLWRVAP